MTQSYLKNGETLALDVGSCSGCGMCIEVCPHDVFRLDGGSATIARREGCMECGACALNCPTGAVTVRAGVGCATAILNGLIRGTEPSCGCGGPESKGSCCGSRQSSDPES
jgi:NAD-dependent dihydropyrimidine dehydrogenase PreA subunit